MAAPTQTFQQMYGSLPANATQLQQQQYMNNQQAYANAAGISVAAVNSYVPPTSSSSSSNTSTSNAQTAAQIQHQIAQTQAEIDAANKSGYGTGGANAGQPIPQSVLNSATSSPNSGVTAQQVMTQYGLNSLTNAQNLINAATGSGLSVSDYLNGPAAGGQDRAIAIFNSGWVAPNAAPTPTTPATPTTTTHTSFSAVTGENMVNGVYSTGNAQLDSILLGAQSALNTMIAGGQVINPNIALSPSDITTFLNQAKSIVDPYFSNQISQVQQALSQNLTQLQTQYENEQQYDNQQFQASLSQSREASVGAGYGGSARTMSDLLQTQEEQQSLNTLQNQTQSSAQNLVNTAAQSIGSSNVNTLPFNTYTATNQGLGGVNQSGQLSYAPINVTQGSLEAQQQTAESTQATQLASQALQNRALNLYPATT